MYLLWAGGGSWTELWTTQTPNLWDTVATVTTAADSVIIVNHVTNFQF